MRISDWSSDVCSSDPPEGLKEKLAIFRSSGRVFREHNELFTETSWLAALVGQGIEPSGYHPAADLLPDEETLRRLAHKIGRAHVELQSLMRISYAVFCLK